MVEVQRPPSGWVGWLQQSVSRPGCGGAELGVAHSATLSGWLWNILALCVALSKRACHEDFFVDLADWAGEEAG
eukprot:364286-Chlamydomonas_euryale.AAC.5